MNRRNPTRTLNTALDGRYRIERELGEGGMATVYLADDLKHGRKVALKVLKPELAAVVGAERFLAEIKTTANLQHPHILPLHDSGEADGMLFYVMPYVEGESLRERLDRERQLPVEEATRIATNVAEALDYAHRQGVVHRDVKPANVLLQDGKPVISDFGVALAIGAAGGGRLTETGLSIGTPHYMSPEQATGDQNLGPAADIYALGCVLYEMLVGEPPFTGSTPQAVLGKIITGERPSAADQRPSVPEHVDSVILRALEKVPADRFADARAVVAALENPHFRFVPGKSVARPPRVSSRRQASWLAVAVTAGGVVGGLVVQRVQAAPGVEPQWLTIPLPGEPPGEGRYFQYRLSPDGRHIAVNAVVGERDGILLRALSDPEWRLLPGTELSVDAIWSPDSRWIAFFQDQRLKKVPLDGGRPEEVAFLGPGNMAGSSGSWGADDVIVFRPPSGRAIHRVSAAGGVPDSLTRPTEGESHLHPVFLPDGRSFLYQVVRGPQSGIYVGTLDDPSGRRVVSANSAGHFAPASDGSREGHILFVRDGGLYAIRFDPESREARGDAFSVLDRGLRMDHGFPAVSSSDDGRLILLAGSQPGRDSGLAWLDQSGAPRAYVGEPGQDFPISLSPDQRTVATLRSSPTDTDNDIWLIGLESGLEQPITFGGGVSAWANPVWSPDGRRIAYPHVRRGSDGNPHFEVRVIGVEGADSHDVVLSGPARMLPSDWTATGQLLFTRDDPERESRADLFYAELGGDPITAEPAVPIRQDQFETSGGVVAPDGRWVAYVSNETETHEIFVQRFPSGSRRWRVSSSSGSQQPVWSADGTKLYFVSGFGSNAMMVADVSSQPPPGISPIGPPRPVFQGRINTIGPHWGAVHYAVTDGERYLVSTIRDYEPPHLELLVGWERILAN